MRECISLAVTDSRPNWSSSGDRLCPEPADRVVINLRQVLTVRMQIRLKFRSLTTDARFFRRRSYRATSSPSAAASKQPLRSRRDVTRLLLSPREIPTGGRKSARCRRTRSAKRVAPICRLRGCLMNMQIVPSTRRGCFSPKERGVTFLLLMLLLYCYYCRRWLPHGGSNGWGCWWR